MSFEQKFEVVCKLGKRIRVSQTYWNFIITIKHPIMQDKEKQVCETLAHPNEIRISKVDKTVYLYYKQYGERFIAVICKHLNGDGFIIATYVTDNIKEGETIWKN